MYLVCLFYSLASQSSKKKLDRRNGSKSIKTRVTRVPQSDSAVKSSVTDLEDDGFPDIETMSTKMEQDEGRGSDLIV